MDSFIILDDMEFIVVLLFIVAKTIKKNYIPCLCKTLAIMAVCIFNFHDLA